MQLHSKTKVPFTSSGYSSVALIWTGLKDGVVYAHGHTTKQYSMHFLLLLHNCCDALWSRYRWKFYFLRSSDWCRSDEFIEAYCVSNQLTRVACYNFDTRELVLIIFWQKCHWESKQWKTLNFSTSPKFLTSVSVIPGETGNREIAPFHLNAACSLASMLKNTLIITWLVFTAEISLSKLSTVLS